jgi:large subunit ribosomal protein L30
LDFRFWTLNKNKKMATIKIKLIKSGIGRPERQKRTLQALGFRKLNQVIEKEATPQVLGMVEKIAHLITVEK